MASSVVLPQGTYPIGTRTLGPAVVPTNVSNMKLDLDGAAMTDPTLHVSIALDLSLDGGITWASENPGPTTNPFPVTMTLDGGAQGRNGPLATYSVGCNIPAVGNAARRVKAVVIITGQPLTTTGTLTLT